MMVTIDKTEKSKICIAMLVAGISKTNAPVTNPDIAIHKKKKPGNSISTTSKATASTHQCQNTNMMAACPNGVVGESLFGQFGDAAQGANDTEASKGMKISLLVPDAPIVLRLRCIFGR